MEETYTFSRALHLMRYGGKKMKPVYLINIFYFVDSDGEFKYSDGSEYKGFAILNSTAVMGSWVEVK